MVIRLCGCMSVIVVLQSCHVSVFCTVHVFCFPDKRGIFFGSNKMYYYSLGLPQTKAQALLQVNLCVTDHMGILVIEFSERGE